VVPVGHGPPSVLAQGPVSLGLLGFGQSMSSLLVLIFCERKTLLADWFGLAETNKRTG